MTEVIQMGKPIDILMVEDNPGDARLTKEALKDSRINNQLFLAGYSAGGYATVATHRTMQQQYPGEFTVTAAAPAAGAYDMYETANTFLNATTLPFAANIAFGIPPEHIDYNKIFAIANELGLSDFLDDMPDGIHSILKINTRTMG